MAAVPSLHLHHLYALFISGPTSWVLVWLLKSLLRRMLSYSLWKPCIVAYWTRPRIQQVANYMDEVNSWASTKETNLLVWAYRVVLILLSVLIFVRKVCIMLQVNWLDGIVPLVCHLFVNCYNGTYPGSIGALWLQAFCIYLRQLNKYEEEIVWNC